MLRSLIAFGIIFTLAMPNAHAAGANASSIGTQQPKILGPQRQSMGPQQFKPPGSQRATTLSPAREYKSGPRQQPQVHPKLEVNQQQKAVDRAQQSADNAKAAADASRDRVRAQKEVVGRYVDTMRKMPPPKF